MQIKRFYRTADTPHVNVCPPRAYFIPFGRTQDASGGRETSERFTSLNGTWDFRWFPDTEALAPEEDGFSRRVECTDRIAVPGCWQLYTDRGYDPPNYINQDYPFQVDPPHLPDAIPCGFYRRALDVAKQPGKRYYLNFDGVSSCFYLWVNGVWIGYSQVSHANSEFDVTPVLVPGKNVFEVLAIKHCTGSYMEDQDFFRLSGVFRDVYLLERDEDHISDIDCVTFVSEDLRQAGLTVKLTVSGTAAAHGALYGPAGTLIAEADGDEMRFPVSSPALWSSEAPVLYSLRLTAGDEAIRIPVGFRRIGIVNGALLFNGQKIKVRGVNRHDMTPETGYYVSPEQMLQDLYLLKRANVNAIRTSHYPNDPRFALLCQELGFLLIDEADLETHGMGYNYGDWYWDYWAHLCDTPQWRDQCVDRAARLYERDKNLCCVLMWSLGNESGCGENHRAMAAYIRGRRPDALIHYENAHLEYAAKVGRDFDDISDVESRMYAPLEYLDAYLKDDTKTKPFFYCEYVSAWSTGDLPLHWDGFEASDKYLGGCVWEFADHAVNTGTKDRPKYRYGGDFDDYPNDGISCLDGVVHPDRRPRPGYYDMKDCYKPFAASLEHGVLTIRNKRYFTSLSNCALDWTLEQDGRTVGSGRVEALDVAPQEQRAYRLFDAAPEDGFVTVNVFVTQNAETPWADAGAEVGHAQFLLHNAPVALPAGKKRALQAQQTRTQIKIMCGDTVYTFDKLRGTLASVFRGGELLKEPMALSMFRPWLPNAGNRTAWERARYAHAYQTTYGTVLEESTEDKAVVRIRAALASPAMPPAVTAELTFTVTADDRVRADVTAHVTHNAPPLPRFGLAFAMPAAFDELRYLGCGPQETYADRYRAAMLRAFRGSVQGDFEHYARPTECGAHYAVKTASLTDRTGHGLAFADLSERGFSFSARPYADKTLFFTAHDDELPPPDGVYAHVDYKLHAENPSHAEKAPERVFDEKDFCFSFVFAPLDGTGTD